MQAAFKEERYFIAVIEYKDDLAVGFEEYQDLVQEPFRDEGLKFGEAKQIEINGRPALQYVVSAVVENINATLLFTYVEGETYYGQLLCWTLRSKYSAAENEFNQIIYSIKGL